MTSDIVSKTYSSAFYRVGFQLIQQGTVFFFSIILARLLTPVEFGVIALANVIVHYANNFTDLGFTNALVQNEDIDEKHVNSVFTINLSISLTLGVLTWFGAGPLARFFNNEALPAVLRWMSLYYVITTLYHVPMALLRRELDFKFLSINEYALSVVSYVATITLAYLGYSYWSIVYPTLLVTLLWSFVYIWRTKWLPKVRYRHSLMKQIYSFGIWNFFRMQIQMLVSKIDYIVVGRALPVRELGLYEKAFELTDRSFSGFSMSLNAVFFSTFSRLKSDREARDALLAESMKILSLVILPLTFGLVAVAGHFVEALLGPAWIDAVTPLRLLALGAGLRSYSGILGTLNVASGYYKQQAVGEVMNAGLFVLLCFLLVSRGIDAISIAVVVYCVVAVLMSAFVAKVWVRVEMAGSFAVARWPMFSSMVMFGIVWFLMGAVFSGRSSIGNLAGLVFCGAAVYAGLMWLCFKTGRFRLKFRLRDLRL